MRGSDPELSDTEAMVAHGSKSNPRAAKRRMDRAAQVTEEMLASAPFIGRPGRVEGTREFVIHRNHIPACRVLDRGITVLAFRHAARDWPGAF